MDEFWIEKALKYIREHRDFNNVSVIQHGNGDETIIRAELSVGLPARFIDAGSTEIGVRSVEPVSFVFDKYFPLKAPKVVLRDDFPRCFPHINPSNKEVLPCIYEGDLSELLQQSEWMNGILNQLVDWMEKAASGLLINYAQGWEPMRNDNPAGFIVYDAYELFDFFNKNQMDKKKLYYEDRNGYIFADFHCEPNNNTQIERFIFVKKA